MAEFATSIDIDARPDDVFDFLVTADGMTAWMGDWAALDPTAGGEFAVNVAGAAIRGHYLEVARPHRVVFSWGMTGSTELPPGASTVAFDLTEIATGTRVDLRHTNLPEPQLPGHADGWANFLPRLALAGSGRDPGPDSWTPQP